MNKIKSLIGMNITIFLDQYTVSGILELIDEEKVIVKNSDSYTLIYKDKINMVNFSDGKNVKMEVEPDIGSGFHIDRGEASHPHSTNTFKENGVAEKNQYGSVIPIDLLGASLEKSKYDVDLSISASMLSNEEALLARSEKFEEIEKNDSGE